MKLLLRELDGKVRVIADSAIARNNQPWFLPDVGSNWRWHTALAFRISRLGKNIASKFADRYVDAVTLLWVPVADNLEVGHCDYMDGAVVCGEWMPYNGALPEHIAADLVEYTKCATVKNGDIIALVTAEEARQVSVDSHISLSYHNQEVLKFNIK